ncbi:MAG: flagellar hook-basal body complex subunit FliE [Herminiimonas sp.]|nr:flagellar hook-basal body complex subunit FliE [Herminiimonas sp.]
MLLQGRTWFLSGVVHRSDDGLFVLACVGNEVRKNAAMVRENTVDLSDVMIATQKANIGLQATVQVRNKLVSAYHDIMNMQV